MANEEIASVNGIDHVRGVAIGNVTVTGLIQAVDTEPGKLGVSCKIPVHHQLKHNVCLILFFTN